MYKENVERLFQNAMPRKHGRLSHYSASLPTVIIHYPTTQSPDDLAKISITSTADLSRGTFPQRGRHLKHQLSDKSLSEAAVIIQTEDFLSILQGVNPGKAPGPGSISGHLLKTSYRQLSGVFCELFNPSRVQQSIPALCKSSTICPSTKNSNLTCNNDFHPVALTSVVIKSFERIIHTKLQVEVSGLTDPLQFAYRKERG